MTDDLIVKIQNDLNDAKHLIHSLVDDALQSDEDLFKFDLENVYHHIGRISTEIAVATTVLGEARKEESLATAAVKKAEAQAYMDCKNSTSDKKGEGKGVPVETLKRLALTPNTLIPYYERLGEAIRRRTVQEGLLEALKTKRDFLKTLAIKNHMIEQGER